VAAPIWELNERKALLSGAEHVNGLSVPSNQTSLVSLTGLHWRSACLRVLRHEIRNHYAEIMETEPVAPPVMAKNRPCKTPYKEAMLTFFISPFQVGAGDGGPYITLNGTVVRTELGVTWACTACVISRIRLVSWRSPCRTSGFTLRAKQRGEEYLEVAIVIGMSPAVYFAATTKMAAVTEDEYARGWPQAILWSWSAADH
jgi:UbiD family decarboxylase